jgi:purine-nucleoside phosphorylase
VDIKKCVSSAAEYISSADSRKPEVGLILGTGLGRIAEMLTDTRVISYSDIPYFPKSTVAFHKGQLVLGACGERIVFTQQGRYHYYEGIPMREVTLPVRVMFHLGVRTVILTNAAGGIREHLTAGTIALITDHINLMGDNPLIGPYDEFLGVRFPDMSEPYDKALQRRALDTAEEFGIPVFPTVYAAVSGPSYETAAEIRMLQTMGADTVGMSIVPEVLVARQLNMKVLAFSAITDQALPDRMTAVSHQQVNEMADRIVPDLRRLVFDMVSTL